MGPPIALPASEVTARHWYTQLLRDKTVRKLETLLKWISILKSLAKNVAKKLHQQKKWEPRKYSDNYMQFGLSRQKILTFRGLYVFCVAKSYHIRPWCPVN